MLIRATSTLLLGQEGYMNSDPWVLVIQTGGTIDKRYPTGPGARGYEIRSFAASEILGRIRPNAMITNESMFQLDSQDLTDQQRQEIVGFCVRFCTTNGVDRVLITHGTDTVIETAEFLAQRLWGLKIVLTGSMRPACEVGSDAEFNLGAALAVLLDETENGVYIVMHGQKFRWDDVKRTAEGRFVKK